MKIALCFSGQPRFVNECAPLIKANVIQDYNVDVFAHLWFDDDLQTKPYKYGVIVIGSIKEFKVLQLMIL